MNPVILYDGKDHPDLTSGYSIINRYFLPLLGDHYGRKNIIIFTPVYHREHVGEWQGMTVVGSPDGAYGERDVLEHYQRYGCNLLITLGDTWPLGTIPDLAANNQVLWAAWAAIDWLGMPKNIYYRLKPAHKIVSFSKWGENALRKGNLPNVASHIWPGLNLDIWKPRDRDEMPQFMNLLGYEHDGFNILIVGANQERKQVRTALEAIATFRAANLDVKTHLYLHSIQAGERDLRADEDELGLKGVIVYPEPYLMSHGGAPEQDMAKVFACADVLVNVCMEGFGYAVLQAQACGVPAIVLSEGASPELTMFGIETQPLGKETMPNQMTQPKANPLAIAAALQEIWDKQKANGKPLRSQKAVEFVQANFSWQKTAAKWFNLIDSIMDDRVRYCMDIPEPSAELDKQAGQEVRL